MAGPRSVIVVAADAKEAVAEFQKLQATFKDTKEHASGLASVLSGIGQGLGIAGVLGVANAVSMAKDALGDMVRAAMEDERSVVRLGIALRDNVPAWDGLTAAIEKSIAARTRLGFEDDVLRQSLGTLVVRTQDVGRAMELMDLAMNLARFRGMELSAATDLVGKAFDGNVGALRRAGIAVDAHATAEQALAAVLKQTAGQAEAYADTSLGKMEAAQVRVGESAEKLGSRVLPMVAGAMDLLAGAADLAATAVDGLTVPFQNNAEAAYGAGYQTAWATQQVNALIAPAAAAAAQVDSLTGYSINLKYAAINAAGALDTLSSSAANLGGWTGYVVNAQTGFKLTQQQVNKAIVDGANQHQAYLQTLRQTPAAAGGASRAVDDLRVKVGQQLSAAFDTFRKNAVAALDAVHAKKLRAIQDARDLRDAELEAAQAAVQAVVDAERAKVDAARDARRQAELEAAVAAAAGSGDPAAMAAAQQALDDFLTDQRLERMQAEADAKKDEIQKERDANDQKAKDLTDAEEKRYETLKTALDKQLELLQGKLDDGKKKWEVHLGAVIQVLKNAGVDFAKEGENLGGVYGDKLKQGLATGIVDIAKLMAQLLGVTLDEKAVAAFKAQLGIKPKALGGPVLSGSPYIVGEQGPELFVPGSSGTIVPNGAIGGVGALNLSVTVTGPAVFDPLGVAAQQIAEQILPAINRERTRQGVF